MAQQNSKPPIHQNFDLGASHARSLFQPTVFANNSLPPLSPFTGGEPSMASANSSLKDAFIEDINGSSRGRGNVLRGSGGLPPPKGHRHSNSDVLFDFSAIIQYPPQLMPMCGKGVVGRAAYGGDCQGRDTPILMQKQEMDVGSGGKSHAKGVGERKYTGEVIDELFSSYTNLDNIKAFSSSGNEDKTKDTMVSGTKISSGDSSNERESVLKASGAKIHTAGVREGVKRSAAVDISPTTQHLRSLSMDSAFANLTSGDKSPKLPTSLGNRVGQLSASNSFNESSPKLNFDLSGEFSEAELKKIVADERLAEIATSDPKQAKRILANRHSAARSKERKLRYISELEHKVHTLQTEATTLSAQVTILQKDLSGLKSENNELKFRLQAICHQAELRDALHESLAAEVHCLKLATGQLREEGKLANDLPHEISQKHHMFQMQCQHPDQVQVSYCQ